MRFVFHRSTATAALLALVSGLSQATTIGFDPMINDGSAWSDSYAVFGSVYSESGYTFTSSVDDAYGIYAWSRNSPLNADPGGAALLEADASLTITRTNGGAFTLKSFDLADIYNSGQPGSITLTYTDATGIHTSALVMPDTPGLRTYDLGYTGLTSFQLTQDTSHFQLDNVKIMAAVPEPAALVLMLAGLAGLGGLAATRRRAKSQA